MNIQPLIYKFSKYHKHIIDNLNELYILRSNAKTKKRSKFLKNFKISVCLSGICMHYFLVDNYIYICRYHK